MNKLATFVVVLLLACGAGLWFLASGSLNDFVKQQIEQLGSEYTEQHVVVNQVNIELTKGAGAIKGVTVNNPKGYQQPLAMSLGNMSFDIDIKSLANEPIVLEAFVIEQPEVFVEVTKSGKANLKQILDQLNNHLPKTEKQRVTEQNSTAPEPKIRIDKLVVAGTKLTLDLQQLGNKVHSETLPDINLGQVGGEQGLPASELGTEIAKKVLSQIWKQAKQKQQDKLVDKAKEQVKKQTDKLKEKAKKKLGGLFDKLKKDLGNN